MSDESKEKRAHEQHHAHHHNPHKHGHPKHDDDAPSVHPAWYIIFGGVLLIIIVMSWMWAATW